MWGGGQPNDNMEEGGGVWPTEVYIIYGLTGSFFKKLGRMKASIKI